MKREKTVHAPLTVYSLGLQVMVFIKEVIEDILNDEICILAVHRIK